MSFPRRNAARHDGFGLGVPAAIDSDVVIQFRGEGVARFRVQHARDAGGMPDDLSWCDVTSISNRNVEPERMIVVDDRTMRGATVRGWLVGEVNGDFDAVYRRHNAGWLRVLPLDDDDEKEWTKCQAYTISIQKAA